MTDQPDFMARVSQTLDLAIRVKAALNAKGKRRAAGPSVRAAAARSPRFSQARAITCTCPAKPRTV